jgi:PTH1 family peptidyl-tRNA hydrolase
MIRLYAFLGNIGREHSGNRHNVAWQFLTTLTQLSSLSWERKFKGKTASKDIAGEKIWFLVPETYMNNSGESVAELSRFYRIPPEEILAVHDELELPFGTFSLKFSGGLGGHNGLRSMEKHLGTRDYARLRIGIGRPDHSDIAGYVLSDFSRSEKEILETSVFPKAEKALYDCLKEGFDAVAETYRKVNCILNK